MFRFEESETAMTGLDRILETVDRNGEEKIKKLIAESDSEIKRIADELSIYRHQMQDKMIAEAEKEAKLNIENAQNSAKLKSSKQILELKSALIGEAIERAVKKIISMNDEDYFSLMYELISDRLQSADGIIVFNIRDKGRLPKDFIKKINAVRPNCHIKLSDVTAGISGGFILVYGDIEENCSLEILKDEKRDSIRDETARILFKKGES